MKESKRRLDEGVLPIWKPAGYTSHDVVAQVRRWLKEKRIGHTGTLDPRVTGVLPLCIGRSTRLVEYLQMLPKVYKAHLKFGIATDTQDLSGRRIAEQDASFLTKEQIVQAANTFIGELEQTPPMVSAIKIGGKRLYQLAREGKEVARPARKVTIHDLQIDSVVSGCMHPELKFTVKCSKGTYIRTLCVDIGQKLKLPSVMVNLVRMEAAGIKDGQCLSLEQIPSLIEQGTLAEKLISADQLLLMPKTIAGKEQALAVSYGQKTVASDLRPIPDRDGLWKLYREDGFFLGVFQIETGKDSVIPVKVFQSNAITNG